MLSGQPVKRGTMAHDHDVYMVLTDSAAQQYDIPALELYTPQLQALAQRDNHKLYLAVAHRARGIAKRLSGEYDSPKKEFGRALELFGELGTHWQSGRTLTELGILEQAHHNTDAAREHLTRSLREFEGLRSAPDAARVRALLAELG